MVRVIIGCWLLIYIAACGQLQVSSQIVPEVTAVAPSDTLCYKHPSALGIDSLKLHQGISAIMKEAIDSAAFPGGQILIAKSGQIFYQEAFGHHTYDSLRKVKTDDIYDLASITKTIAATLALMKLYENDLFDLDKTLGDYFSFLKDSDKENLAMREVLAHQARLRNWIPYYSEVQDEKGRYMPNTVSADSSADFPNRISSEGLFLHKDFLEKKIYKMIKESELYDSTAYIYSGLSFYLYPDLVKRMTGLPFDQYLDSTFYKPLQAHTMGFLPSKRFGLDRIVPTEIDNFFRMQTLHGVVHDEGAAVMLGISGNAGLFSNSYDLAKIYQMLLNGGTYNGRRYLKESTIEEFTRCQFCENENRRGLGFDKPLVEYDSVKSGIAEAASPKSYGHSGFTGTLVWADPDNELLFIFLSNRVYPTRTNWKLYKMNIRPRIHSLIYEVLGE